MAEVTPIFVSVKEAAGMLGLNRMTVYKLCDEGAIRSQYYGKRRLVVLASVREFAEALPERPESA